MVRIIAAVAVLVVATSWYLSPLRTDTAVDGLAMQPERAPRAAVALTSSEPEPELASTPSERAPVPEPNRTAATDVARIPAAIARPDTRVITGTLVVNDPDGRLLPAQSGSFSLIAWTGSSGRHHPAIIQSGVWQVVVDDASSVEAVSIDNFECDNPLVMLVGPLERMPYPASDEMELRARAAQPSILTVVEADSRVPLARISLVRDGAHSFTKAVHPANPFAEGEIGHDLASPIDIDALLVLVNRDQPLPLLVGAPGFAWKRIEIDLWAGGGREIALDRGGELVVTVSGAQPSDGAELRLYELEPRRLLCSAPLAVGQATSFAGLAPGEYALSAELGDWFDHPLVLCEARTWIAAGARCSVALTLGALPQIPSAIVRGTVLVPDAWVSFADMRPGVTLTRHDTVVPGRGSSQRGHARRAPPRRDGYTTFEWALGDVPLGWYQLEISRPALTEIVEVRGGRTNEFELVAPPPIQLHVLAVHEATGLDVEDAHVSWWLRAPPELRADTKSDSVPHPSGRGCIVEVPAAQVGVAVATDAHVPYFVELDLSAAVESRTHVARLRRASGVVLSMRSGGADAPWPSLGAKWWDHPRNAGRVADLRGDGFTFRVTVDTPGSYFFDFPKLDGYHPIPTQVVEILADRFVEHVVELEREAR